MCAEVCPDLPTPSGNSNPTSDLVHRVLNKDIRAAARAMRWVDDRAPGHISLLKQLAKSAGHAFVVGITGTPGAGKSTLVDKLIDHYRKLGLRVGVVAVDPTSPFSGGAILGDRIRMQRHFLDDGVFIRSLATRGAMGGLSRSAADVVLVMDAFGCDVILLETVGVGQDELEVTRAAHTTVVVVAPGGGDDVQANKAGILEIADVFAVNKADREGADAQVRHLEGMLQLGHEAAHATSGKAMPSHHGASSKTGVHSGAADDGSWTPPVLKTVASRGEGIAELLVAVSQHRDYLTTPSGKISRANKAKDRLQTQFRDALMEYAMNRIGVALADAARDIEAGKVDPYSACESLIHEALIRG